MFTKYFTIITALLAVASAAPLATRDGCTPGQYICYDGIHYSQCVVGGIWSTTMISAAGTTCFVGISDNPWLAPPSDGSGASPAPVGSSTATAAPSSSLAATTPEAQSTTTTAASAAPTQTTSDAPPPPPAQTTTSPASSPSSTLSAVSSPSATAPASSSDCGGFTCISGWETWANMRAKYEPYMGTASQCPSSWGAPNTPEETKEVLDAIESLSGTVDPRFVLAIAMQESRGCVRVITTSNSVQNPGLLQDFNGSHSCNGSPAPCSTDEINGMITDGVSGGDDNLTKALSTAEGAGYKDAFAYAVAARIYNSGSFDPSNLNNGLTATSDYVKDVMARLPAGAPVS